MGVCRLLRRLRFTIRRSKGVFIFTSIFCRLLFLQSRVCSLEFIKELAKLKLKPVLVKATFFCFLSEYMVLPKVKSDWHLVCFSTVYFFIGSVLIGSPCIYKKLLKFFKDFKLPSAIFIFLTFPRYLYIVAGLWLLLLNHFYAMKFYSAGQTVGVI